MALTYIQLFEDIEAHLEPYEDAERGRLMMALMAYAFRGEEPDFTCMPERYGWPALKMHVDRCMASYEKQKANGSRGGRPTKGETDKKQTEPNKTQENPNKPTETQTNHNKDQSQDKDKDQSQEKKKENNACAREEASSPAAADEDDRVYGFDGRDLTKACSDYDKAGELVTAYKLPDTDQSRAALIEDANRVGWEKVEAALKDAALGNSRPMLSVNFYRKVLESEGKPRPANSGGRGGNDGERMLRYSPNERRETYSAAILDFDEVG